MEKPQIHEGHENQEEERGVNFKSLRDVASYRAL